MRLLWLALVPLALAETPVDTEPTPVPAATAEQGAQAFATVFQVLTSPRCLNCHPAGDVPLVGDDSRPHAMQITRNSPNVGLPCATCHRETGLDLPNIPPANPHWGLPPANQAFVDRTPAQLCAQLNDPATTGGRDLAALLEHVSHDSLVLYGWSPGGGRTTPPVSHPAFVEAFALWVGSGGACPE